MAFKRSEILPDVSFQAHQTRHGKRTCKIYSDQAVIDGLKARDFRVILYLYKKYFHEVQVMVTNNSGTRMDAEDVFQEVMIILYKKSSSDCLTLTCSFNTYLYSVCRHLWFQKLNNGASKFETGNLSDVDIQADLLDIQELQEKEELYSLYREHFSRLSDDDQKVLNLYMGKTPAKEIANIMGYKSEDYAKYRKYLCKEKLKNSIINDPRFQKHYQTA